MTVRRLLSGEMRLGLAVFGLAAVLVFVLAGCSDSKPDNKSGSTPSAPTGSTSAPIPPASNPTLTPLPTPSKPWPTPKVTGQPASDAPLAQRLVGC